MAAATKEASSDRDAMNTTANDNNNTTTSGGNDDDDEYYYVPDECERLRHNGLNPSCEGCLGSCGKQRYRRSRKKRAIKVLDLEDQDQNYLEEIRRSTNDEHAVASKLGEIPLLVHRRIELVGRERERERESVECRRSGNT